MLQKLLVISLFTSATLFASSSYIPHLDREFQRNARIIEEYQKGIEQLKERNKLLLEQKKNNPKLYETKPLYEETQDAYIQRIKLNGAQAKNLNFTIKNHMINLKMNIKITKDDENGYYQSSRSFYQEYSIPKDVQESKITNFIDGDYFVIKMPKK